MLKRLTFSAATLFCLTTTAWSQAAQPEADRIKAALEKYVGKEPGVLSVTAKGDAYEIKFDVNPLVKKMAQFISGDVPAFIYTLKPQADGKWQIDSDAPLSIAMKTPAGDSFDYKAERITSRTIFDEVNQAVLDGDFSVTNYASNQNQTDPASGTSNKVSVKIASMSGKTTGKVVAPGIADLNSTVALSGLFQDMSFSGLAAANVPPVQLSMTSAGGKYVADLSSARTTGIYALVAWFIAHPEKELVVRDQQMMKDTIRAALPLWDQLKSSSDFETIDIVSPIGKFTMKNFGGALNASGLNKTANVQFAMSFAGLSIPSGLLPTWSNDLMLKDMKLDVAVSGWDAETGIAHVLEKLDLQKDPPLSDAEWAVAVTKFAPSPIKFKINPSELVGGVSTIKYSGDFSYEGQKFSGEMQITQDGFDAMFEKVQAAAASDPQAVQLAQGLIGAKGLGKADGKGGYAWTIAVAPDGKVTVNGIDVTKLSGNP